jgi:hypothetical protein
VAADAALAASLAAEAADLDDAGFAGGGGGGGGMWNAAASPRTLEARRVREEQVHVYMQLVVKHVSSQERKIQLKNRPDEFVRSRSIYLYVLILAGLYIC